MKKRIFNKKIKKVQAHVDNLGNSTDAISDTSFMPVVHESSTEKLHSLIQDIMKGNEITPFVIAIKEGKPVIEKCIVNADGSLKLPEIKIYSQEDIKRKSKAVRRILDEITPVLHADIENVTYIALMRKDEDKLKRVIESLKQGIKPRLQNRVGCIWLIVGDDEFII